MTANPREIETILSEDPDAILIEITRADGSTPREVGAFMLVSENRVCGTIGGGQLEYLAIDEARRLIRNGDPAADLTIPLGPDIGQCCGGRVTLGLRRVDPRRATDLKARAARMEAEYPSVLIFGAGHTGRALAEALAPLPVNASLIDTRRAELEGATRKIRRVETPIPEASVREAPAGSAFVVMTHDHALDFLITAEALNRGDAAYVGMIGSATKRAKFANWYREEGFDASRLPELVCPIGGNAVRDKRPPIIAALVAAELVAALAGVNLTADNAHRLGDTD
jgi:xanthine dehydrogenase accessory factor